MNAVCALCRDVGYVYALSINAVITAVNETATTINVNRRLSMPSVTSFVAK